MAWTDDRVAILTKLWMEGLSASQVATQLGGVTRNAVIGKVHRLGLSGRAKPSRPVKRKRKTTAAAPRKRRTMKAAPSAPIQALTTTTIAPLKAKKMDNGEYADILSVTEQMCKWPIGDPSSADFRFCGRGTGKDEPYCKAHAQLAYQPARRRGTPQKTLGYTQRRNIQ